MLESAADFKGYIQKLGIMRYEGILLRYLSEAFRGLDRTIPEDKHTCLLYTSGGALRRVRGAFAQRLRHHDRGKRQQAFRW